MRIVKLDEFRKQPEGTVFCKYAPCCFGDLEMFGGVFGENDFVSTALVGWVKSSGSNEMMDILTDAEESGKSFQLETECYGRDALYEKEQLFALYEKEDILQLIETLRKAL